MKLAQDINVNGETYLLVRKWVQLAATVWLRDVF